MLNKCGIPFNINNESNEITLSFCYSDGEVPFELTLKNVDYSFREGSETEPFMKAAHFGKIELEIPGQFLNITSNPTAVG